MPTDFEIGLKLRSHIFFSVILNMHTVQFSLLFKMNPHHRLSYQKEHCTGARTLSHDGEADINKMEIGVVQQFTVVLWGKKKAEGKTRLDEKGDKVNSDSPFISKIWRSDFYSKIFFPLVVVVQLVLPM